MIDGGNRRRVFPAHLLFAHAPVEGVKPKTISEPFKAYKDAQTVKVPAPKLPEGSLWKALANRRSRREFKREAISPEQLSLLIWSCHGR